MERLVYVSEASDDTGTQDVFAIVEASARNNATLDLTGFLLFEDNRFLQLLEGPSGNIDMIMARIKDDPRHHSLHIAERRDAIERWFPNWKMKQLISFNSPPAMEELRVVLKSKEGGERVQAILDDFLKVRPAN